jgi:uridine kinase
VPTLLIAGVSGSGKSTLAHAVREIAPVRTEVLSLDNYERLGIDCRVEPDGHINWEHPDSRDFDRLVTDITSLQEGHQTSVPVELTFRDEPPGDCLAIRYADVAAPDLLVVEGHLLLHDPRVRALGSLLAFVTTSNEEVRLARRQNTFHDPYYDETYLKPGERAFVLPTREHADIELDSGVYAPENMAAILLSRMGVMDEPTAIGA